MRAIVLDAPGPPEALTLRDIPVPSPQEAGVQSASQVADSPASSQSSTPTCVTPSPQDAATQLSRQASVLSALPSSQSSTPART